MRFSEDPEQLTLPFFWHTQNRHSPAKFSLRLSYWPGSNGLLLPNKCRETSVLYPREKHGFLFLVLFSFLFVFVIYCLLTQKRRTVTIASVVIHTPQIVDIPSFARKILAAMHSNLLQLQRSGQVWGDGDAIEWLVHQTVCCLHYPPHHLPPHHFHVSRLDSANSTSAALTQPRIYLQSLLLQ